METLAFFALCVFTLCVRDGEAVRGLRPGREKYYSPEKDFTCLDGSDTVPFQLVNDDYCDCNDGSDEPGTAACPNMLFHCVNAGHKSDDVFSSRVNDKICDCCDGSDEWGTEVSCPNTCQEMGRKAHEEQNRLRELHEQGYQKKLEYSAQGKQKTEESRSSLSQKEAELDVVRREVEELASVKDAAEEPETAAKEEHKERWDAERVVREEAEGRDKARFGFDELDSNSDGLVTVDELRMRYELDDDEDGDVSEEEALGYLNSQPSMDFDAFYSNAWETIADRCQFQHPPPTPPPIQPPYAPPPEDRGMDPEDDNEDYDSDDEDEYDSDDDDDGDADADHGAAMSDYDDDTKALIATADAARSAHREADDRRTGIEREITELKKYLDIPYGVEFEFSQLYNQCYEYTDREYTYKMCSFGKVTQRPKNGGRETNLGTWGKWNGPSDNLYSVMRYEDGEKCWNGPSRSATISIVCGMEEKLFSASEPNRCEYAMEFSTPAVCEAGKHAPHGHQEL